MQQSSVATARAVCVVQLRDWTELIESNCRTRVMNIGEEGTNCFLHKSWRAQPCLGNLDVSQWMLGAALTHRFGHLDLEPNDFWTRQVDGADRGHQGQEERDRETGD